MAERYHRIREIFEAALERDPAEREPYVSEAASGDEELRNQLIRMLQAHDRAGGYLSRPVQLADRTDTAERTAPGHRFARSDVINGRFEIVGLLGAGGMGEVYRAHDCVLKRDIALKVISSIDPDRRSRFFREARAASALNHSGIVHIYDIAEESGVPFIAMELVQGRTLADVIGHKPVATRERLDYAIQIADAVARAHAAGIIHRDLKPSNIMVDDQGSVKILDFGLARHTDSFSRNDDATGSEYSTRTGVVVGTAADRLFVRHRSPDQPVDLLCGLDRRSHDTHVNLHSIIPGGYLQPAQPFMTQ